MNILVVEDESKVLQFLTGALKSEGHVLMTATTIGELEDIIDAGLNPPDVAIMDRMLKGKDSLTILPRFKNQFKNTRILILSALASPSEKAEALDLGADDYLGKPFSLEELSARIRALSRRTESPQENATTFRHHDLELDTLSMQLKVGDQKVSLSSKEYSVLLLFLRHPGRVYNRFQILDKVWDTQFDVESNVVEVTIKNLRQKLQEARSTVKIENRRNVGYWIET